MIESEARDARWEEGKQDRVAGLGADGRVDVDKRERLFRCADAEA